MWLPAGRSYLGLQVLSAEDFSQPIPGLAFAVSGSVMDGFVSLLIPHVLSMFLCIFLLCGEHCTSLPV